MIKNYFYDYHKNKQKYILHFELPFFMINLYVNTSNYLHIEKFTSHKHYYLVFSSLDVQRRLRQIKVHYIFFTLSEKKRLTNLQK